MQRELTREFFVSVTVSVVVSFFTKPPNLRRVLSCTYTWHCHTLAHLFPWSQNCRAHLITLPPHSRLLKARRKTEFHLTL